MTRVYRVSDVDSWQSVVYIRLLLRVLGVL